MWLSSHGYAQTTVANRRHHLDDLVEFLAERDMAEPKAVSFTASSLPAPPVPPQKARRRTAVVSHPGPAHHRGEGVLLLDDEPRPHRLGPASWHRVAQASTLPEATLSAEEADTVLSGPDVTGARLEGQSRDGGVSTRPRYAGPSSSRSNSGTSTTNGARCFVRQGKGGRDRYTPIARGRFPGWTATWSSSARDWSSARPTPCSCPRRAHRFVPTGSRAPSPPTSQPVLLKSPAAATCSAIQRRHSCWKAGPTSDMWARCSAMQVGDDRDYTRVSIAKLRAVHAATHPAGGARPAEPKDARLYVPSHARMGS